MAARRIVHNLFHASRRFAPSPSSHGHRRLVCQPIQTPIIGIRSFSAEASPPRRRRRRSAGRSDDTDLSNDTNAPPTNSDMSSPTSPFTPLNPQTNVPLTSDEYLSLASLSPWVPCPDVVVKRVFEIAEAASSDSHVDLGCGDGRLNFAAVDFPHSVSKSVGIDVDDSVLERARDRRRRRFVPARNKELDPSPGGEARGEIMERLEFVRGDLMDVVERQRMLHRERLRERSGEASRTMADAERDWSEADALTAKISSATIVTMYFVSPALQLLRPYLASLFGGKDVRVITVGYPMEGWEPDWAERVLDLTVFKYDMKMMDNDPEEWRLGRKEDEAAGLAANDLSAARQGEEERTAMQRQKRQRDFDLLNSKLRIHHDRELDDFASFRLKRKSLEEEAMHEHDPDDFEMSWDFDEEEDMREIMRKEAERKGEERSAGKKSLLAGLDVGDDGSTHGKKNGNGRPLWKKPE